MKKFYHLLLFFFFTSSCYCQVVTNNGADINISLGTILNGVSLNNAAGTITNTGTITLTTDFTNAATVNGAGNYNIGGNWSNTGTFTPSTSTVTFNGAGAQTIGATTFNNVTFSGSGTTKTATGALVVNGIFDLNSNATLDMATNALSGTLTSIIGTGILKTQNTTATPIASGKTWPGDVLYNSASAQTIVLGNYNNLTGTGGNRTFTAGTTGVSGTFTTGAGAYIVTGTTIDFNGSLAQNIPAFSFENITTSGGNTKTVNGSVNVSGALTMAANTTLALGSNNITLTSTSAGTARVATMPSSASVTYGTGKFIVQRYIQGRRKFRLMTSAVTTSASATLSTGQEALSIWGNWQNQGNNVTANAGTIITGGSTADGFDQNTTNPSLFTYNEVDKVYTPFSTANGKNTKFTPLKAGVAYYMFVYGDRTKAVSTSTPNFTVLNATGTILTGDQTYNTSSTIPLTNTVDNYTMLGNPYASPVDWATVTKTNLYNTFWGWDPNLASTGGYVTVTSTGTVTLISPFSGTVGLNQYLQSGQAFFVRTQAASPVLIIKETDKSSINNKNAFRTHANNISLIAVNLFDNSTKTLMDGALAAFDNNFSNKVGKEDASKIMGSGEAVSFGINNNLLSINARQMPLINDTLFLKMAKLTKPQYYLQIFANKMESSNVQPYLSDTYLKSFQPLSISDTNRIIFNITSDPASYNTDRFKIIFNVKNIVPVPPVNTIIDKVEIKVFPNPVKNQQINIQVNSLEKGDYDLALYNTQGQQILNSTLVHQGGTLHKIIYLNKKLTAGIYYLSIVNKSSLYNKTIFVE